MSSERPPVGRVSEHGARVAAGKIGCTVKEYRQHEAADERWCALGQHWAAIGSADRCRSCANEEARQDYVPQRAHVDGLKNVRYAGPAFSKKAHRPYTLTPEGANVVTTVADRRNGIPPTAAPSGHINCPAVLGCREGRIPEGWIRERKEGAA